jgi:hypothetical protein
MMMHTFRGRVRHGWERVYFPAIHSENMLINAIRVSLAPQQIFFIYRALFERGALVWHIRQACS